VRLPEVGLKPALIVSSRVVTLNLRPIVARITSVARERSIPTVVALAPGELSGLPDRSLVVCHDVFTLLTADALVEHLGTVTPERLLEVEAALRFSLGLS